jgi:hypothetical protein
MSDKKQTRSAISDELRKKICLYSKDNPQKSQTDIANHFNDQFETLNIDRSTVSKILKQKEKWLSITSSNSAKKFHHKKPKYPLLEYAMQLWIEQIIIGNIFLTEKLIKEKAQQFALYLGLSKDSLKFSNGWIEKFKI